MRPYGGSPTCPQCSKAVYAAEQVMGPGRRLYHKPCLACMACHKRLDSYNLVEHDQEPYCKQCHIKLFGTRDLRSANLPHREDSLPPAPSRALSDGRSTTLVPSHTTDDFVSLSTSKPLISHEEEEERDVLKDIPLDGIFTSRPGRSVPLTTSPTAEDGASGVDSGYESPPSPYYPVTTGRSNSIPVNNMMEKVVRPLVQSSTGTRYGAALGGYMNIPSVTPNMTGSPRKWGGTTPTCPKCGKSVYFAEQLKAVGKTYHKGCLRCDECNTLLDSTRLRDHDGTPLCGRCYSKLHGPAGQGYALLGKAGG